MRPRRSSSTSVLFRTRLRTSAMSRRKPLSRSARGDALPNCAGGTVQLSISVAAQYSRPWRARVGRRAGARARAARADLEAHGGQPPADLVDLDLLAEEEVDARVPPGAPRVGRSARRGARRGRTWPAAPAAGT